MLRARQSDLENARSQIQESLSRLQYQLAHRARDRSRRAKTALEHRNDEHQAEEQGAGDDLKTEVQDLMTETRSSWTGSSRSAIEFQSTYQREPRDAR